MNRRLIPLVVAAGLVGGLSGCVAYPNSGYYDHGYNRGYARYDDSGYDGPRHHICGNCGTITDIQQVYLRDRNTGLGAVIGAIAGGVLGSTIGKGNGRTAATVGGAVAGGFAGNAVENHNERGGEPAWRFDVHLEDGRWATVTQLDRRDLHRGDPVVIRGNHVELRQGRY
ncbi:MAG: glycine zipper 2TM domain-containing protein [Rhodanobacteraceae bacterium]